MARFNAMCTAPPLVQAPHQHLCGRVYGVNATALETALRAHHLCKTKKPNLYQHPLRAPLVKMEVTPGFPTKCARARAVMIVLTAR